MASETSKQQPNNYHLEDLRQTYTAGGHPEDRSQPGLPIVHRKFANPAPLGLLAFATGE
jgi:succinate-acetate transporter protein